MAENKKTIVIYSNWEQTFENLTNEEAGRLIKHLFRYVNDKNPIPPDRITELVFEPIKAILKNDLQKYEKVKADKSLQGRLGNLKRWNKELFLKVDNGSITLEEAEEFIKERKLSPSDKNIAEAIKTSLNIADNDNVNDNVIINNNNSDRHADFKNQCLNDELWKEAIFMQKVLKPETIEFALNDYNIHLIQQSELKHSIKDYKSHFVNWVKKRKEMVAKTENKDRL